jgi:hypothetical protein
MREDDQEEFFRLGLQLSESDAKRLKKVLNLACLGLAVAASAGLAEAGVKSLNQPMAPAPSKNMQLIMLLAGIGVGMVAVGVTCKVMKLKLDNYLSAQSDVASAIGNLSPQTRKDLADEAQKLLRLENNIMQLDQQSNSSNPNYT